jgi:hypothetical protein
VSLFYNTTRSLSLKFGSSSAISILQAFDLPPFELYSVSRAQTDFFEFTSNDPSGRYYSVLRSESHDEYSTQVHNQKLKISCVCSIWSDLVSSPLVPIGRYTPKCNFLRLQPHVRRARSSIFNHWLPQIGLVQIILILVFK